ncbi:hypothetical protein JOD45_002768 [Scopulibacillus daqui]|uniref:Uncharacterized protein n=1 Tax=Scopulibacillus daqui TaxID=1469162 RepID=A0ABS2Q2U4_9BACL|nr:hypothetical protein [Scopulibacillus daqui]MBM7646538.1 hypothetical protein [Scopulibacillus daqui]
MNIGIRYNGAILNLGADNAGIFNGENEGFGWSGHLKKNRSFGVVGHDIHGPHNVNLVFDEDMVDAVVYREDIQFGVIGRGD